MGKKLNDCKLKPLFYHGPFVLNTFCHFYVGIDSEIYSLVFKTQLIADGKNTQADRGGGRGEKNKNVS